MKEKAIEILEVCGLLNTSVDIFKEEFSLKENRGVYEKFMGQLMSRFLEENEEISLQDVFNSVENKYFKQS